jgi:hypothetical protein
MAIEAGLYTIEVYPILLGAEKDQKCRDSFDSWTLEGVKMLHPRA